MYNTNQNMIDNLLRQKDRIDEMIKNYQQPQPINNFITCVTIARNITSLSTWVSLPMKNIGCVGK